MKDKGITVFKSVCRSCHGGCGVRVFVKNGKVVNVKGDPDSPLNKGWMCIKGIKSPDIANHQDRLKRPLKRKGARGDNEWQEISWQTALDEIAEKIDVLRREWGPETIAIGQGTGRHHYLHVVRFANALGTPNWYEPGLAQCFIPRITVSHLTYGGFVVADYYSETNPECIVFWGHNPLISSADGEPAAAVKRVLRKGCRTIAIDPRRSETAKRCEMWLPVRPGTDAALALAMIHVMIKRRLYDREFVENWTSGFNELSEHTATFTPSRAEGITGIKEGDIVRATEIYSSVKPAVLDWGLGIEQNANSLQTVRALALLRALTGNIDIPGGDILGMNTLKAYPVLKDKLPPEVSKKRLGADEFKLLGGWRAYMPSAHIPAIFRSMAEGAPYKIRGLLLFGNNPLLTVANPQRVYEGLKNLDMLVVTDLFMTPAALMADYLLPAAFWTESEHLQGFPLVAENLVMYQPPIVKTEECRQDESIIDELSKRLKLPGSEMNYRDIFEHQLSPTGLTLEDIKKRRYYYPPHEYEKFKKKGFRTLTKKVELYSTALKRMGYPPLPVYSEPPESPVSSPKLSRKFPYILITGSRRKEYFHSEQRQVRSLRRLNPKPLAEVHTKVAKEKGIEEGESIIVSSPRGEIKMNAKVTDHIHPLVVSIDHGWWFPEKPDKSFGLWESNANILTNDSPPYDPAFGSYQLRGILCNIEKEQKKQA